jgi:hypothetical protein
MFLLLVLAIVLLRETKQRSLRSGSIIRKKETFGFQAKFLI